MKLQKDYAPRTYQGPKKFISKGLIIVYTGAGKGKTTAALGAALRALGRGYRVAMVQFIKGPWKTGELAAVKSFGNRFKIYPTGEGFTWETKNLERDLFLAKKSWEKCQEVLLDRTHQVVIFDEINYALQYHFLDVKEVLRALKKKPKSKHVILTGGGAPKSLIELADLVTEMKCIKHPFQQGILAQPGIDY